MSLQNRVIPTGQIVAIPERGTLMGNRGILHDDMRVLQTRRWQHPHWVTCVLSFKNRHRTVMSPRRYTELFFLDEPTALAAGHRPCGECRRADFVKFKALFNAANHTESLKDIDRLMQAQRVTRSRDQVTFKADCRALPDGTYVLHENSPHLIWKDRLLHFTPSGYDHSAAVPKHEVTVLTPACTVKTLAHGYCAKPHPSALA
ncbi:MAG: hypothetical protein AAFQ04_05600 [Pseudomonadota bacterium]